MCRVHCPTYWVRGRIQSWYIILCIVTALLLQQHVFIPGFQHHDRPCHGYRTPSSPGERLNNTKHTHPLQLYTCIYMYLFFVSSLMSGRIPSLRDETGAVCLRFSLYHFTIFFPHLLSHFSFTSLINNTTCTYMYIYTCLRFILPTHK